MSFSGPLHGLNGLLRNSLRSLNLETKVKEQTCLIIWDEVVGEQVSGAAQPEFVRDGIVFVKTKSAVWANELTFYKRDIIDRLNRRLGDKVLKDMVLKVGKVRRRAPSPVSSPETDNTPLEGISLTDAEIEELETAVQAAGGEEAAGQMRELLLTAKRLDKWKQARGWVPCRKCGALQNGASGLCPVCEMDNAKRP